MSVLDMDITNMKIGAGKRLYPSNKKIILQSSKHVKIPLKQRNITPERQTIANETHLSMRELS